MINENNKNKIKKPIKKISIDLKKLDDMMQEILKTMHDKPGEDVSYGISIEYSSNSKNPKVKEINPKKSDAEKEPKQELPAEFFDYEKELVIVVEAPGLKQENIVLDLLDPKTLLLKHNNSEIKQISLPFNSLTERISHSYNNNVLEILVRKA